MTGVGEPAWPITLIDSGPPLTVDDLLATELLLEIPIPAAYRKFLLTHNGGRPRPSGFVVPERKSRPPRKAHIEWFLGITGGIEADNDIVDHWELLEPIFPHLFPIAWDEEWKLVFIGLGNGWMQDAIYYYDNDSIPRTEIPPAINDLVFMTEDFASFLKQFH